MVHKPLREADIFEAIHKHLGVRYIYEGEQVGDKIPEEKIAADILTQDQLNVIPKDMLAELEQAIIKLDTDLIQSNIERLSKQNALIAKGLLDLADKFRCDHILTLIRQAIKEN